MDERRILVTGARTWEHIALVREFLAKYGPGRLVHGRARGLDTIAASIASRLQGWSVEAHPADWGRYGNQAGPLRNQEMVDAGAALCGAFPDVTSIGTFDCVARAERAGIHIVWVPAPGMHVDQIRTCMQHARRRLEGQRLHGRTA